MLPNKIWISLDVSKDIKGHLLKELHVEVGLEKFIVPKGFCTDFASVPRILWALIPPLGKYTVAAVVHDYLYYTRYPRDDADKAFYDIMIAHGVSTWKAAIMYSAVRLFGGFAYRNR